MHGALHLVLTSKRPWQIRAHENEAIGRSIGAGLTSEEMMDERY
jgi:hypothetical protein